MKIKFQCRYCKIIFEAQTFEQVSMIQMQQCFITRLGINHSLKGVSEDG